MFFRNIVLKQLSIYKFRLRSLWWRINSAPSTLSKFLIALAVGITVFFLTSPKVFASTPVTICTDQQFWYPFTYVKNNQVVGLHIDILSQALRNLGYEPTFKPMAWKQCLDEAKSGKVDAIASSAYNTERASFLFYPSDAIQESKQNNKAPLRVTQGSYVAITSVVDPNDQANSYEFKGDLKTLPSPVRVAAGYSIIGELEKVGVRVEEGKNVETNFENLIKDKKGCVIDLIDVANHFSLQPEFSNKIQIQKQVALSKAYYFPFSKKSSIPLTQVQKIWEEIAKVRDDQGLMSDFLKKY